MAMPHQAWMFPRSTHSRSPLPHRLPLAAVLLVSGMFATSCAATTAGQPRSDRERAELASVLQKQTQELVDAVTNGQASVWDRLTSPDLIYAAEDGAVKTKADLLKEVQPLPKDISGMLRVTEFTVREHGTTAITSYVVDESERYFGQDIKARYRETDTWIETASGWQLVAAQVLALRDDPSEITPLPAQLDAYVGTYSLTPTVTYTIRREGNALVGQRSGRKPEPLHFEVTDMLFVAGQPRLRRVFQRAPDGSITGFVERRETWDIRWTRQP